MKVILAFHKSLTKDTQLVISMCIVLLLLTNIQQTYMHYCMGWL